MNLIWSDLKLSVDQDEVELPDILARRLRVTREKIDNLRILKRSVDARHKPELFFVYTIEFSVQMSGPELRKAMAYYQRLKEKVFVQEYPVNSCPARKLVSRPIVVGTGPAGYFAALALARKGYKPLVLERGDKIEDRSDTIERFWNTGTLDPESNVQFGEGGAGTFSDGKLTTRIDDRRVREILEIFVEFGANPEILYVAKPHIGTDILKKVVAAMRTKIEALGGEVLFRTKVTGLKAVNNKLEAVEINGAETIPAEIVILAVGHSARDVYQFLKGLGVQLEAKPFAIGLRIEHRQEYVNLTQYGIPFHPRIGPADYQLTYKDVSSGRGAYTFCMCPGGQVIASSSEDGGIVTNGMSYSSRNTSIANSAVVVTVSPGDFASSDPLAGIDFQRKWEQKAFLAGSKNYWVPAQSVQDFLQNRQTKEFSLVPTYRPGYTSVDLHTILPEEIGGVLERALHAFDKKMKGFAGTEATLSGIESRSSAPVRILRDESGQSVNLKGLFPAGEGAGYAGGITSSAVDGLRAAEKLMAQYAPKE